MVNQNKTVIQDGKLDRPSIAATILVISLFILAFQDALVKIISPEVSLWQFQLVRSLFNTGILFIVIAVTSKKLSHSPKRVWPIIMRGFLQGSAMCLFFGGIPFLSLAEVAAGLYVFPLFVAILSSIVLKERVGPKRITAIIFGFIGTLLILKPGGESFNLFSVFPIMAALCYATSILTTRHLCRGESPVTLALSVSLWLVIVGGLMTLYLDVTPPQNLIAKWPYLFLGWRPINYGVVGLIFVCAVLNTFANVGLAKAYQSAEASWLAPFDYSYLIFATLWGYIFFNHIPDFLTAGGMVLIAVSGAFVAWREGQEHRFAHRPPK